ncbi:MAG: hypothetical protein ACYCXW_06980 [Solirubrobacteraceae bacterium]
MSEAWPRFREAVDAFYYEARDRLRNGESLDPDSFERAGAPLDAAWEWSITIRREAEDELASATAAQYDHTVRLLLVAAAVDAMLASDIAVLDPNPEVAELRSPDPLGQGATYESTDQERNAMLGEADAEYRDIPGIAGAQTPPDKEALIGEAHSSIDGLMKLAEDPGRGMVRGLASVVVGVAAEFVTAAVEADVTSNLEAAANGMSSRMPRFLAEYALKVRAIHEIVPDAIGEVAHEITEVVTEHLSVAGLLAKVAATRQAKDKVATVIRGSTKATVAAADALQRDLHELTTAYGKQTKWLSLNAPSSGGAGGCCGGFGRGERSSRPSDAW